MAKQEPVKQELVKTGNQAIAVPEFIKPVEVTGAEHIGRDDIQMPRLALAQSLSPQVDSDKPEYIPGLKNGDLFNSLTQQNYERGPLDFCIIRSDKARGVEFFPRESGGGVKDFDVPLTDPRMQFTKNEKGESVKPVATKFYDFIIMLLDNREVIGLSFKSSGLKTARDLNGLIKLRGRYPIYAGKYTLTAEKKTNSKGTFSVYKIVNAGWLPDAETLNFAKVMHEELSGKNITIDRGTAADHEEDASFDPATLNKM